MISNGSIDDLYDFVSKALASAALDTPRIGETEPKYVARVFVPYVRKILERVKDVRVEGEGVRRARAARFMGYSFYPDISIMYDTRRLIAYEAKYLKNDFMGVQASVASAMGQASIYEVNGYYRAGLIFVSYLNIDGKELVASITQADQLLSRKIIYRKVTADIADSQ